MPNDFNFNCQSARCKQACLWMSAGDPCHQTVFCLTITHIYHMALPEGQIQSISDSKPESDVSDEPSFTPISVGSPSKIKIFENKRVRTGWNWLSGNAMSTIRSPRCVHDPTALTGYLQNCPPQTLELSTDKGFLLPVGTITHVTTPTPTHLAKACKHAHSHKTHLAHSRNKL